MQRLTYWHEEACKECTLERATTARYKDERATTAHYHRSRNARPGRATSFRRLCKNWLKRLDTVSVSRHFHMLYYRCLLKQFPTSPGLVLPRQPGWGRATSHGPVSAKEATAFHVAASEASLAVLKYERRAYHCSIRYWRTQGGSHGRVSKGASKRPDEQN